METTLSQPPLPITQPREPTARKVGLVMTYNQRETCIEAINSLLVQTLALDLIIVSDDCSTDGTYGVITEHFSKNGKPSNVELYQPEKNLGFIPHFNVLLKNHCRDDDLIFYNAGDDISETSRVEEFYSEYAAKGKPRHFLGHSYVTSFGSGTEEILVPPIESIKENRELCLIASAYHIGASQVFTGALFFDFGPILFDDCYEDLTLGYRALLKDAYHFIPKALLRYRIGGLSSWQKNPLEKKRGRLKSTLTQRAVDSIRSGDFKALTTIQDCYSQYGFSHTPHPDKVRITVLSEAVPDSDLYTHSIADQFSLINNVCEPKLETPTSFLKSIHDSRSPELNLPNIVWIVVSRISLKSLWKLLEHTKYISSIRFTLDLGLISSVEEMFPELNSIQITNKIVELFSNLSIHTSSASLYNEILAVPGCTHISYLPPLQNIDGADPIQQRSSNSRGITIVLGSSEQSERALSSLEKSYLANRSRLGELHTLQLTATKSNGDECYPGERGRGANSHPGHIDLKNYEYVVLIGSGDPRDDALTTYWWSLGAQHCIPTFISDHTIIRGDLIHGDNCLYVSSTVQTWNIALNLVSSRPDQLKMVAMNARRHAYFNYSIQKKTAHVASIISGQLKLDKFFDKFLAL